MMTITELLVEASQNIAPERGSINYDQIGLVVRELSNGAWTISSAIMFLVCVSYLVKHRRYGILDSANLFAVSLIILTLGHFIRSMGQWALFIITNAGQTPPQFLVSATYYLLSIILILYGKSMFIYMLMEKPARMPVITLLIISSISIPIFILFAL